MTPTEFKAIFPEFSATSDAVIQSQIDRSVPYFNVARWGSFLSEGVSNFVAHQLTLSKMTATTGGLSTDGNRKKVGDVEISVSDAMLLKKASNPLFRTLYGQRYLYLVKIIGVGVTVA